MAHVLLISHNFSQRKQKNVSILSKAWIGKKLHHGLGGYKKQKKLQHRQFSSSAANF
jgi:hypothetical protein